MILEQAEFWASYAASGFIYGRHLAGLAYREQERETIKWEAEKRNYYTEDSPMPPGVAAGLVLVTGGTLWPIVLTIRSWLKASKEQDPKYLKACSAIRTVFVARPPKRERLEKRKAELERRTEQLEKELELV